MPPDSTARRDESDSACRVVDTPPCLWLRTLLPLARPNHGRPSSSSFSRHHPLAPASTLQSSTQVGRTLSGTPQTVRGASSLLTRAPYTQPRTPSRPRTAVDRPGRARQSHRLPRRLQPFPLAPLGPPRLHQPSMHFGPPHFRNGPRRRRRLGAARLGPPLERCRPLPVGHPLGPRPTRIQIPQSTAAKTEQQHLQGQSRK